MCTCGAYDPVAQLIHGWPCKNRANFLAKVPATPDFELARFLQGESVGIRVGTIFAGLPPRRVSWHDFCRATASASELARFLQARRLGVGWHDSCKQDASAYELARFLQGYRLGVGWHDSCKQDALARFLQEG